MFSFWATGRIVNLEIIIDSSQDCRRKTSHKAIIQWLRHGRNRRRFATKRFIYRENQALVFIANGNPCRERWGGQRWSKAAIPFSSFGRSNPLSIEMPDAIATVDALALLAFGASQNARVKRHQDRWRRARRGCLGGGGRGLGPAPAVARAERVG